MNVVRDRVSGVHTRVRIAPDRPSPDERPRNLIVAGVQSSQEWTVKKMILVAIVASGVFAYAQTPATACGDEEVWLEGKPGAQVTSTRLRIPPNARLDG